MDKERYNQIFDEAYENYLKNHPKGYYTDQHEFDGLIFSGPTVWINEEPLTKEEFINKSKTDSEFSEKWGLKIEERELSLEERNDIYKKQWESGASELSHDRFDSLNTPAKLITITYNNEKTEIYE